MPVPTIASIENLSEVEARSYLENADSDELRAAFDLAVDRNILEGSDIVPDEAEVHHALYLLRRARGLSAPSFDTMRIELRNFLHAA